MTIKTTLLALLLSATPAAAQPTSRPATTRAADDATPGFALTVYSTADPAFDWAQWKLQQQNTYYAQQNPLPGYGVVRETRRLNFAAGRNTTRFTGVASGIDPTTLRFRDFADPDAAVLEQNYEYDLLGTAKLLEKYVGKTIRLDGKPVTLLSVDAGNLIYRDGDGGPVKFRPTGNVQASSGMAGIELPDTAGLILEPTLVWDVQTAVAGTHPVRVTYETTGLTWRADYTIVTNADDTAADVGAWVTLINQSGLSYPDAKLKLVAGDVQRVTPPQNGYQLQQLASRRRLDAADENAGFSEKSFFEYHLYTLGRPTTLKDNSTKQIELFPTVENVPAQKIFVYYGLPDDVRYYVAPSPNQDRNLGTESNKKVDIYLRFKNAEKSGLGIPLPAGKLRVYKRDAADDTLEFVGEDVLQHTPREEAVLAKLGSAFDLVGERTQLDFRVDYAARWIEEDIEIKLRNRKKEPVQILVKENLFRWVNWEIIKKTQDFERVDSRTVHFPVTVQPDEEATVTYTVRYTW